MGALFFLWLDGGVRDFRLGTQSSFRAMEARFDDGCSCIFISCLKFLTTWIHPRLLALYC